MSVDTWDVIVAIVAVLAFALSLTLGIVELKRYKLQAVINGVELRVVHLDNRLGMTDYDCLLVISATISNTSSAPLSIYQVTVDFLKKQQCAVSRPTLIVGEGPEVEKGVTRDITYPSVARYNTPLPINLPGYTSQRCDLVFRHLRSDLKQCTVDLHPLNPEEARDEWESKTQWKDLLIRPAVGVTLSTPRGEVVRNCSAEIRPLTDFYVQFRGEKLSRAEAQPKP